jgi:hypothetical protein
LSPFIYVLHVVLSVHRLHKGYNVHLVQSRMWPLI